MSETVDPAHPSRPEHVLESIKVWSRCAFLLMVVTVGSTAFPGWGALATLVLALATATVALVTLVKMARAKFPAFSIIVMIMVVGWSLFLGFAALVQLLFFDATVAYADCLQRALTLSRQQQCTSDMSDGLLQQLMGQ